MNEDFRQKAPEALRPRDFNLPSPNYARLSNNLKLVVVEDKRLPIVSFRLGFKSGSINDPADLPGLSSMVATMLTEGTEKRTSLQIASEVERLGASLSANANADNFVIAAGTLSKYTDEVLDLMADVVLNPTFPIEELELQRENAQQELVARRAQPAFLADEQVSKAMFGAHPYSIISATEQSLGALKQENLIEFHQKFLVPNNAVLIAVGDVDFDDLKQKIENLFGAWQPAMIAENNLPPLPVDEQRSIYLVDRFGSAQSNVVLANSAINRTNPDFFPLMVMNQVLGAGASSRLFMNLREQKDFTYGAYSSLDARRHAGIFEATAEVRSAVTGEALHEFFYEFNRIRDEAVPEQELQDAKNYLTGVFPIKLETQEGLINQLVAMEMYDLPSDYLQTYRARINEITIEEVRKVARQYVTPEKMVIVIVGDAAAVEEQIKSYAEKINLFDVSGKPKEKNRMTPGTANEIWNLTLSSPQGDLPVKMTLQTDGGNLSGALNTPLGDGTISGGTYDTKTLNTSADLSFQGSPIKVKIEGTLDGDSISGNVTTGIPGFPPLPFKGTRIVNP